MKTELYNAQSLKAQNDSRAEVLTSGETRVFWLASVEEKASPLTASLLEKIGVLIKSTLNELPIEISDAEECLLKIGALVNQKISALVKPLSLDKLALLIGVWHEQTLAFSYHGQFYLLFQDQNNLFVYPTSETKTNVKFLAELETTDTDEITKIFMATAGFRSSLPLKKFQEAFQKNTTKEIGELIDENAPSAILKFSCLSFDCAYKITQQSENSTAEETAFTEEFPEKKMRYALAIKKYFFWLKEKILKLKDYLKPKAIDEGIRNFQKMEKRSKTVVILLILVLTALVSATSHFLITRAETKRLKFASEQVTKIMDIKSAVQNDLLNNDTQSAKDKIKQALNDLLNLKNDKQLDEKSYLSLKNLIQDEWFKINKIKEVGAEAKLFDFNEILKKEAPDKKVLQIFAQEGRILATTDSALYEVSLNEKLVRKIIDWQAAGLLNAWRKCASSGTKSYCLGDRNQIIELDFTVSQAKALTLNPSPEITDFSVYENRLYLLASKERQIYRYDLNEGSSLKGMGWLQDDNIDLADAQTISVDGSVYLSKTNGEVIKLNRGQKTSWQPSLELDPKLTESLSSQTPADTNYLFLLEAQNKRLIYLNKNDGALAGQLYAENFQEATSFAVLNNQAYLLIGQSLYANGL